MRRRLTSKVTQSLTIITTPKAMISNSIKVSRDRSSMLSKVCPESLSTINRLHQTTILNLETMKTFLTIPQTQIIQVCSLQVISNMEGKLIGKIWKQRVYLIVVLTEIHQKFPQITTRLTTIDDAHPTTILLQTSQYKKRQLLSSSRSKMERGSLQLRRAIETDLYLQTKQRVVVAQVVRLPHRTKLTSKCQAQMTSIINCNNSTLLSKLLAYRM